MACIELDNVSFSYGQSSRALEHVTLSIETGDYVGLVGGNGSGKTTLLKIILGILIPDDGSIRLFGRSPESVEARSLVGYVPQHVARSEGVFPASVEAVVASGFGVARHRPFWSILGTVEREAVRSALRLAEIEYLESRLMGELSGGERQRVFIARALVARPKLLVLDEPTTGVDAKSQESFYRFLGTLNNRGGLTILLVSHDLEVISREVKTVVCLNRTLVCHMPSHEFVPEQFLTEAYGKHAHTVTHHH